MAPGAGTIGHPLRSEADVLAGAAAARSTGHGRLSSADRDEAGDAWEAGVPGYDYYEDEDGKRFTLDPCPTCGKMIPTHLMPLHDNSCCLSDADDSDIEEESDTDDGVIVKVVCTGSTGSKISTHLPAAEVSHLRAQAESDACDEIGRLFSGLSVERRKLLLPELQRVSRTRSVVGHGQTPEEVVTRLHEIRSAYIVRPGASHERIGYGIGSRVTVKGKPGYVIGHTKDYVYVALEPIFGVPAKEVEVAKRHYDNVDAADGCSSSTRHH